MICKYGMKLDAIKHPVLVEEARYEVMAKELNDPQKIVNMFNDSVQLSDKAEEYLYMIALDSKCNALGIFEVAHGTATQCIMGTREILQRALISGAVSMAVLHNHPSGNPIPSKEDRKSQKKMSDAGNIIGINLLDFIIVGKDSYYSLKEERIM